MPTATPRAMQDALGHEFSGGKRLQITGCSGTVHVGRVAGH